MQSNHRRMRSNSEDEEEQIEGIDEWVDSEQISDAAMLSCSLGSTALSTTSASASVLEVLTSAVYSDCVTQRAVASS
jgi:hypothetical protein